MEFTTSHLQFVKSAAHFNQPFKTEFNKISHILMGSEYFYPKISSQIKYNETFCLQQLMKLKFSISKNNIL